MEPVTHALSGAVIAGALPAGRSRWFIGWGALVAASPDIDVFFIHSPLEYLEYHRGITHSFVGGLGLALVCALLWVIFVRWRSSSKRGPSLSGMSPNLIGAWGLAYLFVLHHIWLDCMNSYGTQVFLPFSDYRVRWNALFIVDPLLLIPLAIAVFCIPLWKKRGQMRLVMVLFTLWTITYPLTSLAIREGLESRLTTDFAAEGSFKQHAFSEVLVPDQEREATWRSVRAVHLVPDAFTPFHWKLILEREFVWDVAGYTLFRELPDSFISYAKPSVTLWRELGAQDRTFRIYQRFSLYPALEQLVMLENGSREYIFSDLRFGSTIPFIDDIQTRQEGQQLTFRIMARMAPSGSLSAVRFITTPGAGGDSGWNPPSLP